MFHHVPSCSIIIGVIRESWLIFFRGVPEPHILDLNDFAGTSIIGYGKFYQPLVIKNTLSPVLIVSQINPIRYTFPRFQWICRKPRHILSPRCEKKYAGIPGVKKERFEEALNVRRRSVPLSVLVGQSRYASPMMFLVYLIFLLRGEWCWTSCWNQVFWVFFQCIYRVCEFLC